MESVKKTFRIPELLLKKWTAALRSGEYQQGKGFLHDRASNSYCCLGVLYKVCGCSVPDDKDPGITQLPPKAWAQAHGVESFNSERDTFFNPKLEHLMPASECNDTHCDFHRIADMLEKYAETY